MLDKALRKAKWRQRLMMLGIAVLAVIILVPVGYGALNKLASGQTQALYDQLAAYHNVAEPNVTVGSEMLANNTSLGGNVITKEYKEIDGYVVPWGTFTSRYSTMTWEMDDSFSQTVSNRLDQNQEHQQFQTGTLQKVARFYQTTKHLPNEAKTLTKLPNHVGEIAVTFDRGYTYAQLRKMLPQDLNLTWGYLFNDTVRNQNQGPDSSPAIAENPIGMDLRYDSSPTVQVKDWRRSLRRYWGESKNNANYQRAIKTPAKDLKFRGVILTGTTEHLAKVASAPYAAGTSVGVTVQRVPYIKPTK